MLNIANCQDYSFYRYWGIKRTPTGGEITPFPSPTNTHIHIRDNILFVFHSFLGTLFFDLLFYLLDFFGICNFHISIALQDFPIILLFYMQYLMFDISHIFLFYTVLRIPFYHYILFSLPVFFFSGFSWYSFFEELNLSATFFNEHFMALFASTVQ